MEVQQVAKREEFAHRVAKLCDDSEFNRALETVANRLFPDSRSDQIAIEIHALMLGQNEGMPAPTLQTLVETLPRRGWQFVPNIPGGPLPKSGDLWVSVDSENQVFSAGWVAKVDTNGEFFQQPRFDTEPATRIWLRGERMLENAVQVAYFLRPFCLTCQQKSAMRGQAGGQMRIPANGVRAEARQG